MQGVGLIQSRLRKKSARSALAQRKSLLSAFVMAATACMRCTLEHLSSLFIKPSHRMACMLFIVSTEIRLAVCGVEMNLSIYNNKQP